MPNLIRWRERAGSSVLGGQPTVNRSSSVAPVLAADSDGEEESTAAGSKPTWGFDRAEGSLGKPRTVAERSPPVRSRCAHAS